MSSTVTTTKALPRGGSKYPCSKASLGTKIGVIHHKDCWWEATGPALQEFKDLVPELKRELDAYCETIASGWITFSVYMIGRSDESATPTIMFFCTQKKARENAMHAIKKSGILKRHPGFKVGHRALPPDADDLVQPAGGKEPSLESSKFNLNKAKITYDSRKSIRCIGTEIFVEQAHGGWRQATSNAVYNGHDILFLTVSHVFPEQPVDDYDSDYEIASDTEDEDVGEDDANVTSQGSLTSQDDDGERFKDQPSITSNLPSPRHKSSRPRSHSRSLSPSPSRERRITPGLKSSSKIKFLQEPSQSKLTSQFPRTKRFMQDFGTLTQLSHSKDWAVIALGLGSTLTSGRMQSLLERMALNADFKFMVGSPKGETDSSPFIRTVHGELRGTMHETPLYTKLPNSTAFEEIYKMRIAKSEGLLQMGDCGAGVFEATRAILFGFVVAASLANGIAYIMPADLVFEDIKTTLGFETLVPFDIGSLQDRASND